MAGVMLVLVVLILSCASCCSGNLPLFGLWPDIDPAAAQAELATKPVIVDHACSADFSCAEVESLAVEVWPIDKELTGGQITSLLWVEATCRGEWVDSGKAGVVACAGALGAVYGAEEEGWPLRYTTESWHGLQPSGYPLGISSGGGSDWD